MDEMRVRSSDRRNRPWVFAGLAMTTFAVTLAMIVGSRLSDQALAVLAGAACGVGAAIPTSLLVVVVTRRRDEPRAQSAVQPQVPYPPVVVVAPPGGQQWSSGWTALPSSFSTPTQRHFTVVGEAPTDGDHHQFETERRVYATASPR
jgi:hypothetical protein